MFHVEHFAVIQHIERKTTIMVKKSAMGRGLDAIFDSNTTEPSSLVSVIRICDIEPNKTQPRKSFDEAALQDLSQSIATHGVIQPIVVKSSGDGFYKIIAGERRFKAAKMAGLSEIPAIVRELDDKAAAEVAIIENIQRENLDPVDEASAYQALMEVYGLTQEELAERIGKSRSAIANMLRLLDLPDEILAMLKNGDLTTGHAKVLLGVKYKSELIELAEKIVKYKMSVRETETAVKKLNASHEEEPNVLVTDRQAYEKALDQRLLEKMGRRVKVNYGKRKVVELTYTDDDDLETLLKAIAGDDVFDF